MLKRYIIQLWGYRPECSEDGPCYLFFLKISEKTAAKIVTTAKIIAIAPTKAISSPMVSCGHRLKAIAKIKITIVI